MSRETSSGWATVQLLCHAFGLSRQAFYAALKPRKVRSGRVTRSRPAMPSVAPVSVLEPEIRQIVASHPAWGVRKVWATLRRRKLCVSRKRVWALMKAWGLTLPPTAEREGPALRGHVAVADSDRRWATDLTTVWTRLDGVIALVPVIDCGDRFVFDCEVTACQESGSVLAPVERALEAAFSSPDAVPDGLELRSDHGPQYTGQDCMDLCRRWNLDHTLAPVGRPTGNAVAERFIQTLKVELIWTRDWESIDELRSAIPIWLEEYNQERPHQSLNWMTPAEKRAANLAKRLAAAA